jgi:hypothetical protein
LKSDEASHAVTARQYLVTCRRRNLINALPYSLLSAK